MTFGIIIFLEAPKSSQVADPPPGFSHTRATCLVADGLRPNGLADTTLSNSQASVNPLPIRWQTCQRLAERRMPRDAGPLLLRSVSPRLRAIGPRNRGEDAPP